MVPDIDLSQEEYEDFELKAGQVKAATGILFFYNNKFHQPFEYN